MKIDTKDISKIIEGYRNRKASMLAILQDVQAKYNWLPPDSLRLVSERLCVPLIDVYSVATFYHAFSLTPRGKHLVTMCLGTACHVRGAPSVLSRLEQRLGVAPGCTTKDNLFTLETVNCLGACALAPVVVVDGVYHGQATPQKVDAILSKYSRKKVAKKAGRSPKRKPSKKQSDSKRHKRAAKR